MTPKEYQRNRRKTAWQQVRNIEKRYHWKRKGIRISLEDFETLVDFFEGKCQICGAYKGDSLCPDHDHETGLVRGLLCSQCNRALGAFGDNEAGVRKALEYLAY